MDDCASGLFVYFQLFLKKDGYMAIYDPDFNDSGEIIEILTKDKVGEWCFDGINEEDLPKYEDLPIRKQAKEFAKIKWPTFEWPTASLVG